MEKTLEGTPAGRSLRLWLRPYALPIGLVLIFLFTWTIELGYAGRLPIPIPFPVYLFLGWAGAAAAVLVTGVTQGWAAVRALLGRFLAWRIGWRWYLAALLLIPATYTLAIYLHAALTGLPVDYSQVYATRIFGSSANLLALVIPYLLFEAVANGEETGWRGFVLPRLQARHTALVASLVVGAIWSIWHLPKFMTNWDSQQFAWFTVGMLAKSIVYSWLYNNTGGSLLLVTLLHASDNTAGMFLPINTATGAASPGVYATVVLMQVAAAAVVVLLSGASHLSRSQPKQGLADLEAEN